MASCVGPGLAALVWHGLVASALLLGAPGQKVPAARPEDVSALLKTANDALDRRDLPTAVKALKTILEVEPEMPEAWFNLAYAYTGLGEDEEAVKTYQKALELQPDWLEAHLNLGILLMEMERAANARPHLEKAVALKPENPRAHLYLGRALNATGQPEAAAKQFEEALRLEPSLAIAHFDLGQVYLAQRDFTRALAAFQKAAEIDPKLPQARLGMALAFEGLQRLPEAVTQFEAYLATKPDDLETRFHTVRVYLRQGKNEQALDSLQTIYRANPKQAGVAAALGDVFALLKRYTESERYYREAVATSPQAADLHRAFGQVLVHLEKFSEAEGEFRTCLRLDSKNLDAFRGLATSLYLQKRYAEAVPLFEAQAAGANPRAGIFFVLATCYDHLRDLPKALQSYERFLQLSENQNPDQEWQARQRAKVLRRELRK
jgi:tetratricopeptide (TPR) repeat protein